MSTLKTTNLQNADASSANIVLGQGSGGGATITGVTTTTTLQIADDIIHTGDTNTKLRFPSADTFTVETGGSERLRISSGGLVGFGGQTSPASVVHIQDLTDDGYELKINGNAVQFNRTSLSYIDQLNDTGSLVFRTTSSYTERMRIASGGDVTITTGNLVIGTAGKGIDFSAQTATSATGATQTSEVLDHYEVGTWTPEYLYVTVGAYGTRGGTYVRNGGLVHCTASIEVTSSLDTTDGSGITIGGLPFVGNSSYEACVFGFGRYNSMLTQSSIDSFTNIRFNGNAFILQEGNNDNLQYGDMNATGVLQMAFTYSITT